jgi:Na+:H+ antiporter, NhaC family
MFSDVGKAQFFRTSASAAGCFFRGKETAIMINTANPRLWLACLPIVGLLTLLLISISQFGEDAAGGPIQIALISAGMIAAGIGVLNGIEWKDLEATAGHFCGLVIVPILLLLCIGGLVAVWIASGVIPTLIVLGAGFLHPAAFYIGVLVFCSVISLSCGSAWTTAATIGVAMIAIADASGLSLAITAGAIISGAYFGDKLSPLSDTTNLASGLAGVDLFIHIRYLLTTTTPAYVLALIAFLILGLNGAGDIDTSQVNSLKQELKEHFHISLILLLPVGVLLALALLRIPPLIVVFLSILVAVFVGLTFQPYQTADNIQGRIVDYWRFAATGFALENGSPAAEKLLSRGGMSSMMTTIWLIISAMFFSAMMERSGCLGRILSSLLNLMRGDRTIFLGAGATALLSNVVAADQYLSVVLSTRMYANEVHERGFRPEMLSRTAEDFGTVTSALVPWNTCGAFMAATLGVATLQYAPFCLFNIASPFIASLLIILGKAIRRQ